jgi:hypothetical protein
MVRCSDLLWWYDIGPTSYTVVCVLSFILAWHKPIRTLCWSERNTLSYIRTTTQNDSWIPDKLICIFTFHGVYELFSWITFLLFGGRQMRFPWSIIMTTSLCIKTMSRKCRMFPHKLSLHIPCCFGPTSHRQLYFCFRFCHHAVWCTASAVGLWTFRSTVYTWNYELKQISRPSISVLKFCDNVMRCLLFKYMNHRLEYLKLSHEKL